MSNPFPETAESALGGAGVDSSFYTIYIYIFLSIIELYTLMFPIFVCRIGGSFS